MKEHNIEDFSRIQANYLMQSWGVQGRYQPIAVEKTEGCWIYTTDGRKIFDLRRAHECINLGFRHPKVLQAMREQMEKVVYVTDDFASPPTAELARKLAQLTPPLTIWEGEMEQALDILDQSLGEVLLGS